MTHLDIQTLANRLSVSKSDVTNPPAIHQQTKLIFNFMLFAIQVVERSAVTVPVLLGSLVYIHRANPFIRIELKEWAFERVFLGAIMLANKVKFAYPVVVTVRLIITPTVSQ